MGSPPAVAGDDDEVLVARARAGDQTAFRRLVERHAGLVRALALRVTRSEPDAEEVAQDAWVRAWLALGSFRGESKFTTWLYSIVTRRALDRAAVLRRRVGRETELGDVEGVARDPGEPSSAGLERAIGALPDMQRAVVTLYYFQDRSVADVAATLGLPSGTVKTHLSRARASLRTQLERKGSAEP